MTITDKTILGPISSAILNLMLLQSLESLAIRIQFKGGDSTCFAGLRTVMHQPAFLDKELDKFIRFSSIAGNQYLVFRMLWDCSMLDNPFLSFYQGPALDPEYLFCIRLITVFIYMPAV